MKVYLAGPEVFFPDALAIIAEKGRLARAYGFEPSAAQGDLIKHGPLPPFELGIAIARHNEALMLASDLIIANLTPFRGVSADVGTVYELGFMCALGKPAFAYTNDPRDYGTRVTHDLYAGAVAPRADGRPAGPDGVFVEGHAMADNLMLDGGIAMRDGVLARVGGTAARPIGDLSAYESCLATARSRLLQR